MNATLDSLVLPFQRFLKAEASGGLLLLAATALAMAWANSPWADSYEGVWESTLSVGVGNFALAKPALLWVNDGLMAIFFFVVGLEIKREILVGELKSPRQALLPIAAAIGGMAGPALVYLALNAGQETSRAWAVPTATDIAFAVGLLAILGRHVPLGLKVFLTALAIVDDLGAVIIIAVFYTADLQWRALSIAAALFGAIVAVNRLGVRNLLVYGVLGVLMWLAVLKSGVHATIAGVMLAMAIPATIRLTRGELPSVLRSALGRLEHSADDLSSSQVDQTIVHDLEQACERAQSPLLRLEHALLPWVAFVIMPIFALANAGVDLRGFSLRDLASPVSLGIALGLIVGNQVGIVGMTWLIVRTGLGTLPDGVSWRQIHGVSLLAGIGFTMSLFIASLAFDGSPSHEIAKLGILLGSFLSGVAGLVALWLARSKPPLDIN